MTAPTDGITCGTGNSYRRTSDRSSRKDPERHLVAQQRSSTVMPGRPEIGMCRFWTAGKKDVLPVEIPFNPVCGSKMAREYS